VWFSGAAAGDPVRRSVYRSGQTDRAGTGGFGVAAADPDGQTVKPVPGDLADVLPVGLPVILSTCPAVRRFPAS